MAVASVHAGRDQTNIGNDRLLFGIIFGLLAFWLFGQTTLNIGPVIAKDLGIQINVMNIAVSITALFSGIFVVVVGGLADQFGRVKMIQIGFALSIVGSLVIGLTPAGDLAETFMMLGRILQGFSGAFIMPASLALVKAYWDGEDRQRAVSLWSMGTWGGAGFAAVFGGLVAGSLGWRWIFIGGAILSVAGMAMVAGTPESKSERKGFKFDLRGVLVFMVMMVALQIVVTQGGQFGWLSPVTLGLFALAIVFSFLFIRTENSREQSFVDFNLFRNKVFTGAVVSNLLLNATSGIIVVAMALMQAGAGMSASDAGLLTIGYAISIIAFIRVGEKVMQKVGARKPMLWGAGIVGLAIVLLMQTYLSEGEYRALAIVAFSLFGLGLGFYATPATDAALSNLPADKSGSGAGIFKMASSLGASFGVAISATVFTMLNRGSENNQWTEGLIAFEGRQDNIVTREAAMAAMGVNLALLFIAVVAILVTIPNGKPESK